MKINKEELRKLAEQLQIQLSDEELDSINECIWQITDKLEEILNVNTEGFESMINNIENTANVEEDLFLETEDLQANMDKINNFDGTYVTINKESNE